MCDADREWTIEHAGEQPYGIIGLVDYDETSVTIWNPTRQPSDKTMTQDFRDPEAGERIRAALNPAGRPLRVRGD